MKWNGGGYFVLSFSISLQKFMHRVIWYLKPFVSVSKRFSSIKLTCWILRILYLYNWVHKSLRNFDKMKVQLIVFSYQVVQYKFFNQNIINENSLKSFQQWLILCTIVKIYFEALLVVMIYTFKLTISLGWLMINY